MPNGDRTKRDVVCAKSRLGDNPPITPLTLNHSPTTQTNPINSRNPHRHPAPRPAPAAVLFLRLPLAEHPAFALHDDRRVVVLLDQIPGGPVKLCLLQFRLEFVDGNETAVLLAVAKIHPDDQQPCMALEQRGDLAGQAFGIVPGFPVMAAAEGVAAPPRGNGAVHLGDGVARVKCHRVAMVAN